MKSNKFYYFNKIYNKKDRYKKPKEIFKKLIQILKKEKKSKNLHLIDVGCAGGELLFNLRKNFDYKLTGVDVDEKLLRKAKTKCSKDIIFLKKDIFKNNFKGKKYDIIIFSGVLSIFQNGEKIFKNLMKILKKKGKIFIFDSFNIYSYNLNITATKYNKNKKIFWYKNMYSLDFIEKEAKKFKKKCKFFEFKMKANLKRNNKDLSLGWTETLSGRKIVTSGLGLIQNQFWVKIY